jgi:glutaredoxin 3
MGKVVVYSSDHCAYCVRAKRLLDSKGIAYDLLRVDRDPALRHEMVRRSQRHSVPQIFIGDHYAGGFDELWALAQSGQLDVLLKNSTMSGTN